MVGYKLEFVPILLVSVTWCLAFFASFQSYSGQIKTSCHVNNSYKIKLLKSVFETETRGEQSFSSYQQNSG